jgi:hypothetical protein
MVKGVAFIMDEKIENPHSLLENNSNLNQPEKSESTLTLFYALITG